MKEVESSIGQRHPDEPKVFQLVRECLENGTSSRFSSPSDLPLNVRESLGDWKGGLEEMRTSIEAADRIPSEAAPDSLKVHAHTEGLVDLWAAKTIKDEWGLP